MEEQWYPCCPLARLLPWQYPGFWRISRCDGSKQCYGTSEGVFLYAWNVNKGSKSWNRGQDVRLIPTSSAPKVQMRLGRCHKYICNSAISAWGRNIVPSLASIKSVNFWICKKGAMYYDTGSMHDIATRLVERVKQLFMNSSGDKSLIWRALFSAFQVTLLTTLAHSLSQGTSSILCYCGYTDSLEIAYTLPETWFPHLFV